MQITVQNKVCCACGTSAPTTETDYTLIGRKHAWRLERKAVADGSWEMAWYCPDCWRAKQQRSTSEKR